MKTNRGLTAISQPLFARNQLQSIYLSTVSRRPMVYIPLIPTMLRHRAYTELVTSFVSGPMDSGSKKSLAFQGFCDHQTISTPQVSIIRSTSTISVIQDKFL